MGRTVEGMSDKNENIVNIANVATLAKTVKIEGDKNKNKENKRKLELINTHSFTKEKLASYFRNIYLSRKVDDTEIQMRKQNLAFFQISGAGHEGILTVLGKLLDPKRDFFLCYYRDRALCLALGVTPYEMFCQANGNVGDTASYGRQMPSHWGNAKLNILPKSSNTGTQFNQACGVAEAGLYLQQRNKDISEKGVVDSPSYHEKEIVYVSSGDGTIAQGEFWEGLNTACINKLPVLFLIEDNGYAISVPSHVQIPDGSISKALKNYTGLTVFECDGSCPIESYDVAVRVIEHLRAGKGPVLFHVHVTRPYSHSLSDSHAMYRTEEDLAEELERDVIKSFPKFLLENNLFTESELNSIKQAVDDEVKEALQKCLQTPWPKKETATDFLFSNKVDVTSDQFIGEGTFVGKADIPMAQSINTVLKEEVKRNPLIRIFGQDVADFSDERKLQDPKLKGKGGVFKLTSGVQRVALPGQVFNSPLAEANIIGRALGMAMRGLKPVVEIQFFDYIWTAFMQLKNEMTTTRYRSGGSYKNPMVVRVPIGGYLRGGAMYHSQCLESIFTHCPGLYVVFPSNAADAAGLLRTAIRCDDPVLFLEHKHLYYQGYNRTSDPGNNYMIPFGKANIVQTGSDATIVTWGALVNKSVEAVKLLEKQQGQGQGQGQNGKRWSVEIIDLRTLVPLDMETVVASVRKTNRLLIAHEEVKTSGFAGEIIARIHELCFEALDAPIVRVTAKDCHIPYCPDLEEVVLPQIEDVVNGLTRLLNY